MNLRILKKLSKRAAPLLLALDDSRGRGIEHFVSERGDAGITTNGHDRKHWCRSHAVHDDRTDGTIVFRPRNPANPRYPFIHMREPYHPMKGTPMVGWMSGYECPEWEERDAWHHLREVVIDATGEYVYAGTDDNGFPEYQWVRHERIRNPRDVLRKSRNLLPQAVGAVASASWMAKPAAGLLTSPPDPAMHLKVEPLYSQQQLDALVAEMDSWKEMYAGAITRAERAEAEAAALREDAERLDWLESQMRHYGDGHTEPREASIGWVGWQQSPEETAFPGLRAAIDAARATTPRGQEG